ncbi:zinc finger protein 761 [Nilaparvata lugens]|uniref:zinc finger protein 761 n=1 Tax=Nilaparvata lugens TaxID=108931 RepID=UPI00193DBD9D|nr:zinc finger protein 761 [Nilaparvata lugens]
MDHAFGKIVGNEIPIIFVKNEIPDDTTMEFVMHLADQENDAVDQGGLNNGEKEDNEMIGSIKEEIDIDEEPLFNKELCSNIPVHSVIPKTNNGNEGFVADNNDIDNGVMVSVKNEIDIDESPSIKEEFFSDNPKVNRSTNRGFVDDNVADDNNNDDSGNEVMFSIKDKIEMNGKPLIKEEYPRDIQAQSEIQKTNKGNEGPFDNNGIDAENYNDDDLKNDLKFSIKDEKEIDETPLIIEELFNSTPVQAVIPKNDPLQLELCHEMESEICGKIAIVRLSRLEDEEACFVENSNFRPKYELLKEDDNNYKIGSTARAESSSSHDDSSDDNANDEGRPALTSLRQLRITRARLSREQNIISDDDSDTEKTYKCGKCRFVGPTKKSLATHSRSHNRKESCDDNDEYIPSLASLRESRINRARRESRKQDRISTNGSDTIQIYKCDKCKFVGRTKEGLKTHLKNHNVKKFTCKVCKYVAKSMLKFEMHQRIHTGEKPYKCDICNFKCAQKEGLKRHTMYKHTKEKPYSCTICNSKFSESSKLTRHMQVHTGKKHYNCKMCHFKFSRLYLLQEHEKTHTVDHRDKRLRKDSSEFKPRNSKSSRTPRRKHTVRNRDGWFCCTECSYKSAYHGDLCRHRKIHTGEKPFSCDICGYQCIHFFDLKRHIRIHTGEKPFGCQQCDIKFTSSSELNAHRKTKRCRFNRS